MKEIILTKGYVATVDDEDFLEVSRYKWQADVSQDGLRVYAITTITTPQGKRNMRLHRLVMNAAPDQLIDHRGGNATTLDCRKSNLRIASKGLNAANSKLNKRNQAGFKGVSFHRQTRKWRASIVVQGKRKSLGLHNTPYEASTAYQQAYAEQVGLASPYLQPHALNGLRKLKQS